MRVRIYTFKWPSYLSAFLVGLVILYLGVIYHGGLAQKDVYQASSWTVINQKIIIDAGHGGVDPGAQGASGALEKDITLAVALQLRKFLQQAGAEVIMIREDDRDLSTSPKGYSLKKNEDLRERAKVINESEADVLVSIHVNSIPSDQWSGAQTFYNPKSEAGEELAQTIQKSIITIMDNTTRKEQSIDSYLLNKTAETPGAIVEIGFISNPKEEKLLLDRAYQERLAWSIFNGISSYLIN
ncbi:MAG: N-acetylmuramoyl-L-alanine amidase CwlD [Bacillota bacterium]|nr:N-acetylmuramoyl-L-alanine amidase CwlD [Bacillota bacterium]